MSLSDYARPVLVVLGMLLMAAPYVLLFGVFVILGVWSWLVIFGTMSLPVVVAWILEPRKQGVKR